jgi:[ribosomal protein S5]-alanine N-acetyltransferase
MDELFDFEAFPILETPRLTLREIAPEDADAIFAIRGDFEVTRLNTGPAYPDVSHAAKLIKSLSECFHMKDEIRWGITRRGEDVVIGMVGYNFWARADSRAQVGYDLAHADWGQGIMPEALHAVIRFGWERMGLNRIEADCSADNAASIRVLEKVGFRPEGRQRDQYYEEDGYHDLLLWGLLKREYVPPDYQSR